MRSTTPVSPFESQHLLNIWYGENCRVWRRYLQEPLYIYHLWIARCTDTLCMYFLLILFTSAASPCLLARSLLYFSARLPSSWIRVASCKQNYIHSFVFFFVYIWPYTYALTRALTKQRITAYFICVLSTNILHGIIKSCFEVACSSWLEASGPLPSRICTNCMNCMCSIQQRRYPRLHMTLYVCVVGLVSMCWMYGWLATVSPGTCCNSGGATSNLRTTDH